MTPEGRRHGGAEGNWRILYALSLCLIEDRQILNPPAVWVETQGVWNTDPESSHPISVQVLFVDSDLGQVCSIPTAAPATIQRVWSEAGPTKKEGREERVETEPLAMWHLLGSLEDQSTDQCCLLQTWGSFCWLRFHGASEVKRRCHQRNRQAGYQCPYTGFLHSLALSTAHVYE